MDFLREMASYLASCFPALLLLFAGICAFSRRATLLGVGLGLMALSQMFQLLMFLSEWHIDMLYETGSYLYIFGAIRLIALILVIIGTLQIPKTSGSS